MDSDKVIDVLIPVYNCEKYITKCLYSLLNQTYSNIHIIIADDGSTDSSLDILKNFESRNKNIIVYSKPNEKNISKTRNFLLDKIEHNLFTFFDADDYAEPTYIEELFKILYSFNADVAICSKVRHKVSKNYKIKNSKNKIYFFKREEALSEMLASRLYNGTVYCKLFRSTLIKNNKFNEKIHYGEDLDFCFKIMQNANKFVFSNKKLYHYIVRTQSIVTSKFNENKLSCVDCYENIILQTRANPILLSAAKAMQGLISVELLYYIWRDKFKSKNVKIRLKKIIKNSLPYIKKTKNLPILLRLSPLVLWFTKFM